MSNMVPVSSFPQKYENLFSLSSYRINGDTLRMKRLAQISLIMLVLLCILGVVSYLDLKSKEKERQKMSSILVRAIQKNRAGIIDKVDVSLLTSFSWDKLYVFGPYTPPKKIDTILDKYWIGSRFTEIKSSDRISLLVFTKNGQVVQYLESPRSRGDFSPAANETGYSMIEAQFIVDEKGQMIWAFANK